MGYNIPSSIFIRELNRYWRFHERLIPDASPKTTKGHHDQR
jgi:hypothetical protein